MRVRKELYFLIIATIQNKQLLSFLRIAIIQNKKLLSFLRIATIQNKLLSFLRIATIQKKNLLSFLRIAIIQNKKLWGAGRVFPSCDISGTNWGRAINTTLDLIVATGSKWPVTSNRDTTEDCYCRPLKVCFWICHSI